MSRRWCGWVLGAAVLAAAPLTTLAAPPAARAEPAPSRGELLYENHCTGCHTSVLHVRNDHRANSIADVYDWARHWSDYQKLGWSDEEVADVTAFLGDRYYHFGRKAPAARH